LQQEILPEQMVKLLNDGRTDLLPGFVSQRTRRPFKAYLMRGADGKVSFQFEERKPKADKASGAQAKAGARTAAKTLSPVAPVKKPAEVKTAAKKASVKKVAAKKIVAKKAVAKKTVAKKAA